MHVFLTIFSYGGLADETHDAVIRELFLAAEKSIEISYNRVADDALISRSRSRALGKFLRSSADVMFQLDHDIVFSPGALLDTCRKAWDANAVVAGLYSFRAFGRGHASRPAEGSIRFVAGGTRLVPADYLATGFMAIPRAVAEGTVEALKESHDPDLKVRLCGADTGDFTATDYYDTFRPIPVKDPLREAGKYTYASEDWSWCARVKAAGFLLFLYENPLLGHVGKHIFTVKDGERHTG